MSIAPRIPESTTLDLVLHDWRMLADPLDGSRRQWAAKGPVVFEKWGPLRVVNLYGPDANSFVLQNKNDLFSNRRAWTFFLGRIFPNGLMLRDGDDHRLHRRVMRVGFGKAALASYLQAMYPAIERRFASLPAEIEAYPLIKLFTLELAWNVFVGESSGRSRRELNHAFETMVAASLSLVRWPVPPLLLWRGMRARRFIRRYLGDRLESHRRGDGKDMFSLLSRAEDSDGQRFTDDDVLDHMVFMMMAAHDTTTSSFSSMLYELGRHPEWQERCRAEVDAIDSPEPTLDDLERMPIARAVFREVLRRYPPLPVLPRVSNAAFEYGGHRIPADVLVVVHPIFTHHMPEYWRDPDRFDPERFLPPRNEHEQHAFLFAPFAGGGHLCLGMHFAEVQVKAMLVALLRTHRFRVEPGYRMPFTRIPISKPLDGLPLVVERRRDTFVRAKARSEEGRS